MVARLTEGVTVFPRNMAPGCPACGLEMDRDLVSAKLILESGLKAIA
jgi:hypothetical protein